MWTTLAAPLTPQILDDLHSDSALYQTLLISILELGSACGPFLLGPLSELFGRKVILNIANIGFLIFAIGTALSQNISMLIAFRFLSGVATAAPILGPGIVSDLFKPERRGFSLSMVTVTTTLGPALGPIAGAYIGERAGWRWVFWLSTILQGAFSAVFLLVYRETYKVTILIRKAERLGEFDKVDYIRQYYSEGRTGTERILHGIIRPLTLLFTAPAIKIATVIACLTDGYVYIAMVDLAPILQSQYGFSEGASGLAYLGLFCGLLFGAMFCLFALDYFVHKSQRSVP